MAELYVQIRAVVRVIVLVAVLLVGLFVEVCAFPWLSHRARKRCIQVWSRVVLWVLAVRLQLHGEAPRGACLIASNHLSWIDILVINGQLAAQFVAKAEIRAWPVVGLLVARAGTHFIERGRRKAVHHLLAELVQALKSGHVVAVFPESTTNDGIYLKPFHANFLQASVDAQVAVKPLGIRYFNAAIDYVGDTTFLQSLWLILLQIKIVARAEWGTEIPPSGTRHELCQQAQAQVSVCCGLPVQDLSKQST
jgi:1-acyl-sn-glycerol-3-phosphate acyltransferase